MTLLPELKTELVGAAERPGRAQRFSARVATAIIAAVVALLLTAPPTVARRPAHVAAPATQSPLWVRPVRA